MSVPSTCVATGSRRIWMQSFARIGFDTAEEFWMNLKSSCGLRRERRALRDRISAIIPLVVAQPFDSSWNPVCRRFRFNVCGRGWGTVAATA